MNNLSCTNWRKRKINILINFCMNVCVCVLLLWCSWYSLCCPSLFHGIESHCFSYVWDVPSDHFISSVDHGVRHLLIMVSDSFID